MTTTAANTTPEARLADLGLVLPAAPLAVGNYAGFVNWRAGRMATW
jgi:hypothetical protein